MARLVRGENPKIDKINDLVEIAKTDEDQSKISDALAELITMFKPMMIKVCSKWSNYFNDSQHKLIRFDELLSDAEYWFIKYTLEKYTIDGDATYNKFIKDHIDARIRYIYECQMKYYKNLIFPDPSRNEDDDHNPFDSVTYNYSSTVSDVSMEDDIVDTITNDTRIALAHRIIDIVDKSSRFNDREKRIFREVMCGGVTQDEMSKRLGISRTRVVQILRSIKTKLRSEMENDNDFWELICQTDINFD